MRDIKQNLTEIGFTESDQIQPAKGDGSFGSSAVKRELLRSRRVSWI